MVILIGFAFLAGLVTIFAPCIWPILPIVLSSSAAGTGNKRPLGITIGLMTSFAFFTLAISTLVHLVHFDPEILRTAGIVIIGALGLAMAIPRLSQAMEALISRLSSRSGSTQDHGSGFFAGFATGASLGIVWSPCAGPILAAIAALATTGKVTVDTVLVTLSYVTGVGIPLLAIGYGGRRLVTRTRFLSRYTGRIQQAFGVVMLLSAVAMFTDYDRILEAKLLDQFPVLSQSVNGFESSKAVAEQLDALKGGQQATLVRTADDDGSLFNANTPSPELVGINRWFNTSAALNLKDLRGHVVLVDFWTYTCINCIRTLPHLESWYEKYKDLGLVVVGVHTPEFRFEHDSSNVAGALQRYAITYPVAQDNDYATWNNFNNEYWPAEYLIDARGNIRRTHFGEGEYDEMEEAIRALLQESGRAVTGSTSSVPDVTPTAAQSPETYLGASRSEYYAEGGSLPVGERTFVPPAQLRRNSFSFGGQWKVKNEYAVASRDASLNYRFLAAKVFLVLRPGESSSPHEVRVFLDGKPVTTENEGADVQKGFITVNADRLYSVIDLKGKPGEHVLRLDFDSPGIEAFAFTFG